MIIISSRENEKAKMQNGDAESLARNDANQASRLKRP